MYLAPSLSDQQNTALWAICAFFTTLISALFVLGILGSVQRNR